jgi:RNA polymerase sigma-70 factor (ECF subfamily)
MNYSSESELIKDCLKGDASAWNKLFDLHYAPCVRFIFQLSPDLSREDSEEIAQEVFLSVIKNLSSFNRKSQLQTWIFKIALNKTRDFLERRKAAKRGSGINPVPLEQDSEDGTVHLDIPDNKNRPDKSLLLKEDYQILTQALDILGDPCRTIIQMRYFGDLSYEEIALILNMNPKTVSSRLSKCIDKLQTIFLDLNNEKIKKNPV